MGVGASLFFRKMARIKKKRYICVSNRLLFPKFFVICTRFEEYALKNPFWRDARVVEEARLESV